MAPDRNAWAEGFATQARSDWQTYELFAAKEGLAPCHRLHYLQMACEKIAKAYRLRLKGVDIEGLLVRHIGFDKFMSAYFESPAMKQAYRGKDEARRAVATRCRLLAEQVEKLAPAVDKIASPANAEYPWAEGETVVVPCAYAFPAVSLLRDRSGITFLKIIERVIRDFETTRIR